MIPVIQGLPMNESLSYQECCHLQYLPISSKTHNIHSQMKKYQSLKESVL